MPLKNLTQKEQEVVGECLIASLNGPFFSDDDFHILFGLHRKEVLTIIKGLPDLDDSDELTERAINNAINNLIGFPHNKDDFWYDYISVPPDELERILKKWKKGGGSGLHS